MDSKTTDNYLISILIPVFNKEKQIKQCLDSVCGQTYSYLDIVLIDDCSTDDSFNILLEYKNRDKRIRLSRHSKNMGVSATRNELIDKINGDYFMFVDADDYIKNETCELLINYIKKYAIDMLFYKLYWDDYKTADTLKYYHPRHKYWVLRCNLGNKKKKEINAFTNIPVGKIYKSYLKQYCFFEGKISEDFYFSYKPISFAQKIGYIDASLYYYDKTDNNSITHINQSFDNTFFVVVAWCERIMFYENRREYDISVICASHAYASLLSLYKCNFQRVESLINDRMIPLVNARLINMRHPIFSLKNVYLKSRIKALKSKAWSALIKGK